MTILFLFVIEYIKHTDNGSKMGYKKICTEMQYTNASHLTSKKYMNNA